MSRLDVLRSLLRAAGDGTRARLGTLGPIANLRERLKSLRDGRVPIPVTRITPCLARAEGISSLSAAASGGAIRVHATLEDGESMELSIEPLSAHFAARGAKELSFRVQPEELAHSAPAKALVGSLAGLIARTLFAVAMPGADEGEAALAERDGPGRLRVDLRSLPSLRSAPRAMSLALDALSLDSVEIEDGALVLRVRLPGFG
ncbi:MAG: hypothetical protein GXP55_08970 [Deltaproteobacteria bacterium]|nr:hypothetical protein [Deltaproteobacteria bacterium]